MKLKVKTKDISDCLASIGAGTSQQRLQNVILSNVLAIAENGKIGFIMADGEFVSKASCFADIEDEGAFCCSARRMDSIFKTLEGDGVDIESTDNIKTNFHCAGASFSVFGLHPSEYPISSPVRGEKLISVDSRELLHSISKACGFASRDDTRTVFSSILLHYHSGDLFVIGTDGKKLLHTKVGVSKGNTSEFKCILTVKNAEKIVRSGSVGNSEITVSDSSVSIFSSFFDCTSTLLASSYPAYERVIPTNCENKITINKEKTMGVLKRASAVGGANTGVSLNTLTGSLKINIIENDSGSFEEFVPCVTDGVHLDSVLNCDYLAKALSCIEEQDVDIFHSGEKRGALLIKGDKKTQCVLMPVGI